MKERYWSAVRKIDDATYSLYKQISALNAREAGKLKKRLRLFMCIYIPVILLTIFLLIYSDASATPKNKNSSGSLEQWVEESATDGIYTYSAGSEQSYSYSIGQGQIIVGEDGDITIPDISAPGDFIQFIKGEAEENMFAILTGQLSEDQDDTDIIGKLLNNFAAKFIHSLMAVFGYWLRWFIMFPFIVIEQTMMALGIDGWPGSIYGLILGRVGSGGAVTNNIYAFELVDGNIYGVAGSIVYSILASVSVIGIILKEAVVLSGVAWSAGSGESKRRLKEISGYTILCIALIVLLPFLVYMVSYIRDCVLYELLKVTEWASIANISGSTNVNGQDALITNVFRFVIMSQRTLGVGVGNSYNPYLDRALDFQNGTFMDSLLYSGTSLLLIVYIVLYIGLAVDTTITFAITPISLLTGKMNFLDLCKRLLANIMTPIIDMLVLLLPLLFGSMQMQGASSYTGVALIELVICFSYFPVRSSIRANIGGASAERAERMGMGSLMAGMGAFRLATAGAGALIGNTVGGLSEARMASDQAALSQMESASGMAAGGADLDELKDIQSGVNRMEAMNSTAGTGAIDEQEGFMDDRLSDESGFGLGEQNEDGVNDDSLTSAEQDNRELNAIEGEYASDDGENIESDAALLNDANGQGEFAADDISGGTPADSADALASNEPEQIQSKSTEAVPDDGLTSAGKSSSMQEDSDAGLAMKASRMANEYEQKASAAQRNEQEYRNRAAGLGYAIEKAKNGNLTSKEYEKYGISSIPDALQKKAFYQQQATREAGNVRRYKEAQSRAEQVCNNVRMRMGLGGRGQITADELNRRNMLQQMANTGNFRNPEIYKALSPGQQSRLWNQTARNRKMGVAAGVVTTSALAPIVLGGTAFMPTTAKAALGGIAAGIGGKVSGAVANRADMGLDMEIEANYQQSQMEAGNAWYPGVLREGSMNLDSSISGGGAIPENVSAPNDYFSSQEAIDFGEYIESGYGGGPATYGGGVPNNVTISTIGTEFSLLMSEISMDHDRMGHVTLRNNAGSGDDVFEHVSTGVPDMPEIRYRKTKVVGEWTQEKPNPHLLNWSENDTTFTREVSEHFGRDQFASQTYCLYAESVNRLRESGILSPDAVPMRGTKAMNMLTHNPIFRKMATENIARQRNVTIEQVTDVDIVNQCEEMGLLRNAIKERILSDPKFKARALEHSSVLARYMDLQ